MKSARVERGTMGLCGAIPLAAVRLARQTARRKAVTSKAATAGARTHQPSSI